MIQSVDHVALLPGYLAAGTAVVALLVDLFTPPGARRRAVLFGVATAGTVATGIGAVVVSLGAPRGTFCTEGGELPGDVAVAQSCSYVADRPGAVVAVLFCALTLGVLGFSAPTLRRQAPPGEYTFLLLCSMTGGVVLGYSRDLLTLLVAMETLTLPLYTLVALRRRELASVSGAVTFFVVSVVSTTVSLMGAALLYALTGALHFDRLAAALDARPELRTVPLTSAAVVLVLVGLVFKVAAVPFHAWAPGTYDGAPLPVAAYLSTASKLGGVVAVLYVAVVALRPWLFVVGPVLAMIAALTMTVGNLVALRQQRMVRLLAWSSVAQAGYILAPLGVFALTGARDDAAVATAVTATIGYAVFYVLIELGAFGAVIGLRGARDGGDIESYRGVAHRAPGWAAAFALALAGLAGLPPGLAGLFAKVVVVRALLEGGALWLALVVAANAVVGLAYYVRVAAVLYRRPAPGSAATSLVAKAPAGSPVAEGPATSPAASPVVWPVVAALAAVTLAAIVVGFAPQWVLDAAATFAF